MTHFVTDELASFPELPSTIYLSGVSTELTRSAGREDLGLLATPASSVHRQSACYDYVGLDNGRYVESKRGITFDPDRWLRWLEARTEHLSRTLFAALPDVLEWFTDDNGRPFCVGNLEATLEQSAPYVDAVKSLGFPAALVAQDGLTSLAQIPFEVDALFIGGSDGYKLGSDVVALAAEARAAGLWVHVGRVNSWKRLSYCSDVIEADSADGTYIGFKPSENGPKVLGWLDRLEARSPLKAAA